MNNSKKMYLVFLYILVLINVFSSNSKVNIFYLTGITTKYYPDPIGTQIKEVGIEPIDAQVYDTYEKLKGIDNKVVIGHSLGGLKAMAYAGYYSKHKDNPIYGDKGKLLSVITIGAPLKGFTGLAKGRNHLNSLLTDKGVKLLKGVSASCKSINAFLPTFSTIDFLVGSELTINGLKDKLTDIFDIVDLTKGAFKVSGDVLNDVSPGSEFIKNYVDPIQEEITPARYETYKKQTGTSIVPIYGYQTIMGLKMYVFKGFATKPTYKFVSVYIPPVTKSIARIDSGIALGMIVGGNNDPLNMMGNELAISATRSGVKLASELFEGAKVTNTALSIVFGLGLDIYHSIYYGMAAKDAETAADMMKNYRREFGDLIGSSSNDGFIAESSQSRLISHLGGRTISPKEYTYREPTAVHTGHPTLSEGVHSKVWGVGAKGGDHKDTRTDQLKTGSITRDGRLDIWILQENGWNYN